MSCTPISFVLNLILCLILSCYNLSCQVYTKTLPTIQEAVTACRPSLLLYDSL
jgi:hypothetical protein